MKRETKRAIKDLIANVILICSAVFAILIGGAEYDGPVWVQFVWFFGFLILSYLGAYLYALSYDRKLNHWWLNWKKF